MRYNNRYCGGYGEEVITALCGSAVTGSIPVSPPEEVLYKRPRSLMDKAGLF